MLRGEGIRPIGDPNEILYQEADVLIVAATSGVITEKNQAKVKAPVIFEGANKPISKGAEIALTRRGITVFPDFVANAGTAELFTVGMLADCQIEEETILRLIKNITVNATVELMRLAEEKQISHREAAKVVSTLNLWKQVIYAH